jgi:hypothetical protein
VRTLPLDISIDKAQSTCTSGLEFAKLLWKTLTLYEPLRITGVSLDYIMHSSGIPYLAILMMCLGGKLTNRFRTAPTWGAIGFTKLRSFLESIGKMRVGGQTLIERTLDLSSEKIADIWTEFECSDSWEAWFQDPWGIEKLARSLERVFLEDKMSFFSTEEGEMGWAHVRALPGDRIYIIPGRTVPVILRENQGGGFLLAGDAWVHGIMYAGVLDGVKEDDWVQLAIH